MLLAINLLTLNFPLYAESLNDYLWKNRVIITFSNTEKNLQRRLFMQQINQYQCEYKKRDLVHIDLIQGTDQYIRLSKKYSISGHDFKLLLLGKDGEVKLNTSSIDLTEVFSLIDTMPMRKREMPNDEC